MALAIQADGERVERRILVLRGEKVLLDSDLAELYGVSTKRLNEQVKRNRRRFPSDFMFSLTDQELMNLKSQIATSSLNREWGGRRKRPLAFTEHGAVMAASILSSAHAIAVSVYVVRAFVRLRSSVATHRELATKLDELEKKTGNLALKHDELSAATREQFRQVIDALRQLMSPLPPKRRPIGFVTPKQ